MPSCLRRSRCSIRPCVPSFAINPAIKGPRYTWTALRRGRIVNYLGVPGSAGTTWLIWLQEPDPSAPEAFRADEEHHQLLDGSSRREDH